MKIKDINGLFVAETEKKFRALVAAEDETHARELAKEYFEEAGHEPADFKVKDLAYYADPNLICFDCDYVICEGKPQKEKARPTLTETIFAILQDPFDFEFNLYWVPENDVKENRLTDFFEIKPNGADSGRIKKSEFFKKHIPFFGIMIKSLVVSFDTIANAKVIKCNGIEENGKKRYDIYISGEIYKFTVRNAVDDCSLKYGNNMNLEVMSDTLIKISSSSYIFLSNTSLSCLRSVPKYYARLDDLNVGLKVYTSYREYCIADIVNSEVKSIDVENTACGQICHIVAYEPKHKNVVDREATLSEYSGKIVFAEDINFYLNSLYKLEEVTDLNNNERVEYHFYNTPRLESSAKKEVNIDELNEDDTYIFQFRYYADKHKMEVGLSPVKYRDPKYTINNEQQKETEQPNCCTKPVEKDVVRDSIEQTLRGITDPECIQEYHGLVPAEDLPEEAPEMEFDRFYHNCHIDSKDTKINIASLFLVELEISSKMDKGETGHYKIAVYCESEDMIGEIILAFLDDIGYDEEDLTSMSFKPFKNASKEEMCDKYQYTIVVQKKLNSDKYDMWIDNGFNPPGDEEPAVKNDEEEEAEMDNVLTVEEFVNSKVHDAFRCVINYYLANEYSDVRPSDGLLDNDPEDETILFTSINHEGYKILREDFLKSEIEDITTDPIDGCEIAVYVNPKYAQKLQTFDVKSIVLDVDNFIGKKVKDTVESILAFGASVSNTPVRITYYDASDRRLMRSDIHTDNIYLVNCNSEGKTEYKTISEYLAVVNPEKRSLINTYHFKDTRRVDVVERYKYLTQDDLYDSIVIAIHQGENPNDKKNGRLTYFIGIDTGKMICKDINYDVYKNHTIRCAGSMLKYKDLPILETLTESKGRENAIYSLTAIDKGAFLPIVPTVNGFYLNGIELRNFGEWMMKSITVSGNNIELFFDVSEKALKEAEKIRNRMNYDNIKNTEDFSKEFTKAVAEEYKLPVPTTANIKASYVDNGEPEDAVVTSLTHEEADQLCKILGITKGDKICSNAKQKKDESEARKKKIKEATDIIRNSVTEAAKKYKFVYDKPDDDSQNMVIGKIVTTDEPNNVKDLKEFSKEFAKAAAEASNVPIDMLPTPDEVKDKREEVMEIIKKYLCTPVDPADANKLPDKFSHAAWVKAKIMIEILENYDAFSKVMEILWKVFEKYPSI